MSITQNGKFNLRGIEEAFKQELSRLPRRLGNIARTHFLQSFRDGGFTDSQFEPWQPRKPIKHFKQAKESKIKNGRFFSSKLERTKKSKQDHGRALLVKTGDLRRSIQRPPILTKDSATIFSDLPYAAVHNEGLHSGRGAGFTMPKREFVGHSSQLDKKIYTEIENRINAVMGI